MRVTIVAAAILCAWLSTGVANAEHYRCTALAGGGSVCTSWLDPIGCNNAQGVLRNSGYAKIVTEFCLDGTKGRYVFLATHLNGTRYRVTMENYGHIVSRVPLN